MDSKELENSGAANAAENKEISASSLGQHYPSHYPRPQGQEANAATSSPLGLPLTIQQVAALLGCSAWSVRNTWIPKGLPHLRSGPNGRLVFFTNQVVRFIQRQQQGGRIT